MSPFLADTRQHNTQFLARAPPVFLNQKKTYYRGGQYSYPPEYPAPPTLTPPP